MAAHRRLAVARCARVARYVSLVIGLHSLGSSALATCDLTAASPEFGEVSSKVALASRNATVCVPAGTASWGANTLVLTKGIKLIGAGRDSTVLIGSTATDSPMIHLSPDVTARATGEEMRIEGFTFYGAKFCISGETGETVPVVVGWNLFSEITNTVVTLGKGRGVIYKNNFNRCQRLLFAGGNDRIGPWMRSLPFIYGNGDNLFFEDNTIFFSSEYPAGAAGWLEAGQGGRFAIRYNNWDYANSTVSNEVLDAHGFSGWHGTTSDGQGRTGTMITEFYGNTVVNANASNRYITHRGSWGLYFNNIFSGDHAGGIQATMYGLGSDTGNPGSSGCQDAVEAVVANLTAGDLDYDTTITPPLPFSTSIENTFAFNNTHNGAIDPMTPYFAPELGCGVADGNGFSNYNASFGNGTDGIGRGINTPTTTGNPAGAAYWVASDPAPTVDPAVIQNGHLWKRVGGVWTDYYHPYTYPHPLRSDAVDSAPTMPATDSATFTTTEAGTHTISRTGQPAPTFSKTGSLPSGVTLNSAGVLSGTPASGTEGVYPITITATNGLSPDATQAFTLTVIVPPLLNATETPGTGSFTHYSHATSTVSGTYEIKFQNLIAGDRSVLIDSVKIDGSIVTGGSFESPVEATFEYLSSAPGWSFIGGGIQANGSAWSSAVDAVDGTQTAFIQGSGATDTSTLSLSAGIHTVEYYMAQRTTGNAGDQTVQVTLTLIAGSSPHRRASAGFGW